MGYEDRDYFREKPQTGFQAPTLGRTSKVLLGLLVLGFILSIIGATPSPGADLLTPGKSPLMEALALSGDALVPYSGGFPKPWQLFTSAIMFHNVLSLLITAIVGVWLIGAALERDLGWRTYAKFLIGAQLIGAGAAALLDPLLVRWATETEMVYSMGIGSVTAAVIGAFAGYRGSQPGWFGWRIQTWVLLLLGLNLVFALATYTAGRGGVASPVTVVQSVPGLIAGACFGWFVLRAMARRGTVRSGLRVVKKEEDYGEYVRSVGGMTARGEASADTRRRERDQRRQDRETRRREDEQAALDALLERISREGIGSLSRSEKAFLERVSKRKREEGF